MPKIDREQYIKKPTIAFREPDKLELKHRLILAQLWTYMLLRDGEELPPDVRYAVIYHLRELLGPLPHGQGWRVKGARQYLDELSNPRSFGGFDNFANSTVPDVAVEEEASDEDEIELPGWILVSHG